MPNVIYCPKTQQYLKLLSSDSMDTLRTNAHLDESTNPPTLRHPANGIRRIAITLALAFAQPIPKPAKRKEKKNASQEA